MNKNEEYENLRTLYLENGIMSRVFLDWRYKVMTRFYLTIGAILLFVGYIFEEGPDSNILLFIPFLLISFISFFSFLKDNLMSKYLKDSLNIGDSLELKLKCNSNNVLSFYSQIKCGYIGKHSLNFNKLL